MNKSITPKKVICDHANTQWCNNVHLLLKKQCEHRIPHEVNDRCGSEQCNLNGKIINVKCVKIQGVKK